MTGLPSPPAIGPFTLLDGVFEAAAATLGIADLRHRSARPDPAEFERFADTVFARVAANWAAAGAEERVGRSRANWRWWVPQVAIAPHNRSPEVMLERAVAAAAVRLDDRRWSNQVPIASGLVGNGERRRAIDLVRQFDERHFSFIELKIGSDTPLYAAVELLGYAAIWRCYRQAAPAATPLLTADRVDLRVLAPAAYYAGGSLASLEAAVDAAVARIGAADGVALSFGFDVLAPLLAEGVMSDDAALLAQLGASAPLHRRALFLPGVPAAKVRAAFDAAAGNEIASGKFASPQSSAALAANGFGWFLERPGELPPFPGLEDIDWPTRAIALECGMHFPWRGGRRPWLDAVVDTERYLIGVESKRFEPFRDAKVAHLGATYDRPVWGEAMAPFAAMRDRLRGAPRFFHHLDAAQLVKHALGLATEGARLGKAPVLLYLYAEPGDQPAEAIARHRAEIDAFAQAVAGSAVRFAACRWRDWLARFEGPAEAHAARVLDAFAP